MENGYQLEQERGENMLRTCSKCGRIHDTKEPCKVAHKTVKATQIKKENKRSNNSKWKKLRMQIIARDGGCCQRCLIKYGKITMDRLEVHHIKSYEHFPHLEYEKSNLITLDRVCNAQLGTKDKLDFEWKEPIEIEEEITLI